MKKMFVLKVLTVMTIATSAGMAMENMEENKLSDEEVVFYGTLARSKAEIPQEILIKCLIALNAVTEEEIEKHRKNSTLRDYYSKMLKEQEEERKIVYRRFRGSIRNYYDASAKVRMAEAFQHAADDPSTRRTYENYINIKMAFQEKYLIDFHSKLKHLVGFHSELKYLIDLRSELKTFVRCVLFKILRDMEAAIYSFYSERQWPIMRRYIDEEREKALEITLKPVRDQIRLNVSINLDEVRQIANERVIEARLNRQAKEEEDDRNAKEVEKFDNIIIFLKILIKLLNQQ
ncbi:MAG: hypothetical protein LBG13_00795 [Holosporales bacterium]|nr:hypothetical protein [Holosporales bacterium]